MRQQRMLSCAVAKYEVHDAWWLCWKLSFHTANENDREAERMPKTYHEAIREIAILRTNINDLLDEWEKKNED